MGVYNPDAPFVLGNEFSGIVNSPLNFQELSDTVEYGYPLTTTASRVMQDARVYAQTPGFDSVLDGFPSPLSIHVYPAGMEDASGPVRSLIVPANSGLGVSTTTTAVTAKVSGVTTNAAAAPGAAAAVWGTAVQGFGNQTAVGLAQDSATGYVVFYFNMAEYAAAFTGKRILGVNIIYQLAGNDAEAAQNSSSLFYGMFNGASAFGAISRNPVVSDMAPGPAQMRRLPLGSVYQLATTPFKIVPFFPASLQFFNAATAAGSRIGVFFERAGTSTPITGFSTIYSLTYVALEVIYCEEQRVIVACGTPVNPVDTFGYMPFGAWPIAFTDLNLAANPTLPAAAYTVTVSLPEFMDFSGSIYPPFNALTTAYNLPGQAGVQVVKPYPLFNNIGSPFTELQTSVIPQLTLHTSTGPIPESQVYGTAQGAGVYSGVTVIQTIDSSPAVFGSQYTQARYFARYFGAPEAPLVLTSGAASCSLTKAAHDALPPVVSGWKEVTLPLSTAVGMGSSGLVSFSWTSTATIGNRWEVLCQTAPAITGVAGDNLQQVVAAQRLDSATYLAPSGASADLNWIAPTFSSAAADTRTDAVLMFSQAPPVLTLSLSAQSLAVTGVGLLCGNVPRSMPNAVTYQRITWSSPALTGSGFGYYELQRFDTIDNAWTTVMLAYTQSTVSFNDFEARVGLVSSYRIRVANNMGFLGAFSATVNGTIAAPGVTGGRDAGISALIFTSNASQSGRYTLAYPQSAPDTAEDITFLETSRQVLQTMYGKNFSTAFAPLERGGEQFTRVMLVQNAQISGPLIEQGFQSFRDLAWAQLPYVCVRNEIGDRWYANVQVSGGTFQRNRTIQLATMQITETSQVPAAVDPVTAV